MKKIGFIDKTGRFVVQPQYSEAAPFSEGLARVAINENGEGKVGFIDHRGKFVIPTQFNTNADFRNSTDFSEGLAGLKEGLRPTVTRSERFAFIDRSGAVVLSTNFFLAGAFHNGLAPVCDLENEKWGFIDRSGEIAIPIQFDWASEFSEELAIVTSDRR
jgi:WG containing repeat